MYRFPINTGYAKLTDAAFTNNIASFSVAAWVRFSSIDGARAQRIFTSKGVTNQMNLRKVVTTNVWFTSVTAGGVVVTRSSGVAPTAGVLYHVCMTWEKNNASGMKLYLDGSLDGSASTTSQTSNYDSGEAAPPMWLAAGSDTADKGLIDLEGFAFWPGLVLSANQVAALRFAGWPALVGLPTPAVHWLLDGRMLTEIPDVSGNGRHITSSNIFGSPTDQGMQGKWEREGGSALLLRTAAAAAAGPPGPNPWTTYPTRIPHPGVPTGQLVLSGLTPGGTYEMQLTAFDEAGNESAQSDIVEAVAREATVVHTEKRVFLGHAA